MRPPRRSEAACVITMAAILAGLATAPSPSRAQLSSPPAPPKATITPATPTDPEPAFRSRLRLADEYHREQRWEDALELYREIVESHPENAMARRGLKACLLELKLHDELQALLEEELERWGEHPTLLEELGTVAIRQGNREVATQRWMRILDIQDRSRGSFTFVADLMTRHRLLDEALVVYAEAELLHPGRFVRQKASLHELRFEFDAATVEYLRFLESAPTALSYVEGRLMRIGENEEGLAPVIGRTEEWMAENQPPAPPAPDGSPPGMSMRPTHIVFRKLLGDLYLEAGDHEGARQEYFRLVDEEPIQYSALLVFGKRCQSDGEHEVAIRVFERILEEIDDARAAPTALSDIVMSRVALEHWDEALASCEHLMERYPETDFALAARYMVGRILRTGKRDPAAAEAVFRELIALDHGPWNEADPQFEVAECAIWQDDLETAGGIYASIRMRRFSPETMERATFEEGRIRLYRGEMTVADSLFKEIAQAYPKGLHVNDALQFSILINTNPDGDEVLGRYAEARLRLRTGQPEDAATLLRDLDRDHGDALLHDETLLLLGEALRAAGEPQAALAVLARAVDEAQVMDLAAEARFLRGSIFAEDLLDAAAALSEYEELLVTYPETLAADRARDLSADLTRALP